MKSPVLIEAVWGGGLGGLPPSPKNFENQYIFKKVLIEALTIFYTKGYACNLVDETYWCLISSLT